MFTCASLVCVLNTIELPKFEDVPIMNSILRAVISHYFRRCIVLVSQSFHIREFTGPVKTKETFNVEKQLLL